MRTPPVQQRHRQQPSLQEIEGFWAQFPLTK
jgi:hypothetical protein